MPFAFDRGSSSPTASEERTPSILPGLDHLLLRESHDPLERSTPSPGIGVTNATRPSTGRLDDYVIGGGRGDGGGFVVGGGGSSRPTTTMSDTTRGPFGGTIEHRPSVSSIHTLLNDFAASHIQTAGAGAGAGAITPRSRLNTLASSPSLTPRAITTSRFSPRGENGQVQASSSGVGSTSPSGSNQRRSDEDVWSDGAESSSSRNVVMSVGGPGAGGPGPGTRPTSSSSRLSSCSSASLGAHQHAPGPFNVPYGYYPASTHPAHRQQQHPPPPPPPPPPPSHHLQPSPHHAYANNAPTSTSSASTGTVHPSNHSRAPISRTTKACNACRSRKVRCDAGGQAAVLSGEEMPCSRCRNGGVVCVYSGQQRKRGPTPGSVGAGRPPLNKRKSSAINHGSPYGEVVHQQHQQQQQQQPPSTATSLSDSVRSGYSDYRLTTPPDEYTIQFPPPGQVSPGGGRSRGSIGGRHVGGSGGGGGGGGGGSSNTAATPLTGVRVDGRPASPHETMRYDQAKRPRGFEDPRHVGGGGNVSPGGHPLFARYGFDRGGGASASAAPSPRYSPHQQRSRPGTGDSSGYVGGYDATAAATGPPRSSSLSGWGQNTATPPTYHLSSDSGTSTPPRAALLERPGGFGSTGIDLPPVRLGFGRGSF